MPVCFTRSPSTTAGHLRLPAIAVVPCVYTLNHNDLNTKLLVTRLALSQGPGRNHCHLLQLLLLLLW
jgi:hypothetical protein